MNEYTDKNGVRYVARPAANKCIGCEHDPSLHDHYPDGCDEAEICYASRRMDGIEIVWVRADAQP